MKSLKKIVNYLDQGYWFFILLYSVSFFFAYSFLMNQASMIAALFLLTIVCLLLLLVDLVNFVLLLLLGWSLALICYFFLSPVHYFGKEHVQVILILMFLIVTGSIIKYKTIRQQQRHVTGLAATASMLAHELRTPLLGIKSGSQVLADYLPQLLHVYELAQGQHLLVPNLSEKKLKQLEGVNERIIREIDDINMIVDMFLVKASGEYGLQNISFESCSIGDCLSEALAHYPFKSKQERALVNWQGDFIFIGSRLLMQHVFFNLLKNALYAIESAQKGQIQIWVDCGDKMNTVYFKDTAQGMSKQQLAQLFTPFYTTTFMGTGVGLAFCKLVMNHFGGEIDCEAQEGKYTQFALSFPKKFKS